MSETSRTAKIKPLEIGRGVELPAPNAHRRLATKLEEALDEANEIPAGDDIADVLRKLLASAKRREIEARIENLPDITDAAEAA